MVLLDANKPHELSRKDFEQCEPLLRYLTVVA